MTLQKDRGDQTVTITCDHCPEELGEWYGSDDFAHMVSMAREAGWQFHGHGSLGYTHQCPSCVGEVRRNLAAALFDDEDFDLIG